MKKKVSLTKPKEEDRCTCDEEYVAPHTCPFKADVNNDSETLCQCCRHCRRECALDV